MSSDVDRVFLADALKLKPVPSKWHADLAVARQWIAKVNLPLQELPYAA